MPTSAPTPPGRDELRLGRIYWLDDCPPLEGEDTKRRPVVLVTPSNLLRSNTLIVVVVAATTRAPANSADSDAVRLPSIAEYASTTTGLPKPCWALPRWRLRVNRARLIDSPGYLGGAKLHSILQAVLDRSMEPLVEAPDLLSP